MPYRRKSLLRTPLLQLQELALVHPVPGWSDAYRVESPRLLFPLNACFEYRAGAHGVVCDAAHALALTPAEAYRLRQPSRDQRSLLLVLDDADVGSTRRVPLALRDHLALRLWARAAQLGADELALEERLAGLAARLLAGRREPQRVHRAVERARAYIAGNPAHRDTLADIGRAAFCSPFHLARAFRRFAGQSLHGYRTQLRMRLALDRLQQGERDLNTLAADLGYASHSHFSAAFRRTFGVAPSRLRTNLTAPPVH